MKISRVIVFFLMLALFLPAWAVPPPHMIAATMGTNITEFEVR